jgi:hypothetical protein
MESQMVVASISAISEPLNHLQAPPYARLVFLTPVH